MGLRRKRIAYAHALESLGLVSAATRGIGRGWNLHWGWSAAWGASPLLRPHRYGV